MSAVASMRTAILSLSPSSLPLFLPLSLSFSLFDLSNAVRRNGLLMNREPPFSVGCYMHAIIYLRDGQGCRRELYTALRKTSFAIESKVRQKRWPSSSLGARPSVGHSAPKRKLPCYDFPVSRDREWTWRLVAPCKIRVAVDRCV